MYSHQPSRETIGMNELTIRKRTYMAEVMPMQIRGKGSAFATGIGNWAVSTLWAQVSPIALGHLQWRYYFVFVGWSKSQFAL